MISSLKFVLRKEAIEKSEVNSKRSSIELEKTIFARSKTKEEYKTNVTKFIMDDRDESLFCQLTTI